jgi:hypothetical protein
MRNAERRNQASRQPHFAVRVTGKPDDTERVTSGVRRETLCRIPGTARKNLEERSWV